MRGCYPSSESCCAGAAVGESSRESADRIRCRQRHNSVSEHPKLVHSGGQPISHSTNRGFKVRRCGEGSLPSGSVAGAGRKKAGPLIDNSSTPHVGHGPDSLPPTLVGAGREEAQSPTTSLKGREFFSWVSAPAWVERWYRDIGVGQSFTAIASGVPMPLPFWPFAFSRARRARKVGGSSPSFETKAFGVGHREDEQALALVRRADFRRREESALNLEAQSVKVSPNALGAARREHPADVLNEDEPGARLDDDAAGRAPEVSVVVSAEALAGEAVRLARDAANDSIHEATPWAAVEGSGIAPHRRAR